MPPQNSQRPRLVRKAQKIPSRIDRIPANLGRFVRALAADPVETLGYVPEAVSHHLFDRQVAYNVEENSGPALHRMLGARWPCEELEDFHQVWADIGQTLSAKGLAFGRWTYGEYWSP